MTRILILIILMAFFKPTVAQEKVMKLNLKEVIDLATKQSIDAFKEQNMYLASYWEYKYYKADKLPFLAVGANPLSYNNSIRQDYIPQDQTWQFSLQKNLT